jgi:integrase
VDDSKTPWDRQAPSKDWRRDVDGDKERGFTGEEAVKLLNGDAGSELHDLMRIAALSGMRIDEPYRLLVRDCSDGVFNIRKAKTKAGVRRVPIHPDLTAIVERRTAGKDGGAFLFPEAGPERPGRPRSGAVSKRFGHYLRRLGLEVMVPGKRSSLVTFHSWRRFFVTAAEAAGVKEYTVQQIVGHKPQGVTKGTYTDPSALAVLRGGVEAVRLPEGAEIDGL